MTFEIGPVLLAARSWFQAQLREGVFCLLCGRHAKIRTRTIRAAQAQCLIRLVYLHESGKQWAHTRELGPSSSEGFSCPDFPTLKHWGLLIPRPGKCDPTKKSSGYWGVTQLAIDWVKGTVAIPREMDILDDEVTGTSQDLITIQDALKASFNYSDFASRVTPREPRLMADE